MEGNAATLIISIRYAKINDSEILLNIIRCICTELIELELYFIKLYKII